MWLGVLYTYDNNTDTDANDANASATNSDNTAHLHYLSWPLAKSAKSTFQDHHI